jgi:tRNA(fMet)-specific endonuclease VapC
VLPERIRQQARGSVAVSAITAAELEFGVARSVQAQEEREKVDNFLRFFTVVPFDHEGAKHFGAVKSALSKKGMSIGTMDTLLAAHALSLDAVMVTDNVREFRRVPGLIVEDWTK